VAIIATDLAEMLGSAIALVLLFPKLKVWHGVLITAVDVMFLLAMRDPLRGTPVRIFELLIAGLVSPDFHRLTVIFTHGPGFRCPDLYCYRRIQIKCRLAYCIPRICSFEICRPVGCSVFVSVFHLIKIPFTHFEGTAVGIIGATVMPHSLFLGSALATQDRVAYRHVEEKERQIEAYSSATVARQGRLRCLGILIGQVIDYFKTSFLNAVCVPDPSIYATKAKRHSERENNPLGFVLAHIYHGIADLVITLGGFAVVINSLYVQRCPTSHYPPVVRQVTWLTHVHDSVVFLFLPARCSITDPNLPISPVVQRVFLTRMT
jgi:metal iron transporter